ncbi:MAG: hypothetical protein E6J34_00435 [Chloroflexi bacterium]|nr:MAG: hypothetical protein E6J34_00435 [Chloroflexota bacterium]
MMNQIFKKPTSIQVATAALLLVLSVTPLYTCTNIGGRQNDLPLPTLPPRPGLSQGLYESCTPSLGKTCFDRLKQMAQVGFTLVLNYDLLYGTADQQLAYAQQAHVLGMIIIWPLHNPAIWNGGDTRTTFPLISDTCGCSDTQGFIGYVINLVKGLPATWGYYIGDEVPVSDHAKLKVISDLVKELDPNHPRLFVASSYSAKAVQKFLAPFADTAEVLAVDYYPVGSGNAISEVAPIAQAVQTLANQEGKQSAMVLQSFSWADYPDTKSCFPLPICARFPTREEMHQMFDLTIKNTHPTLILWFSYYGIVGSSDHTMHWRDLVEAARE